MKLDSVQENKFVQIKAIPTYFENKFIILNYVYVVICPRILLVKYFVGQKSFPTDSTQKDCIIESVSLYLSNICI